MESNSHLWKPLTLHELNKTLKASKASFWISGGVAIDTFLGKPTRAHDDLDICIDRSQQLSFQMILAGWDLKVADPPGSGNLRDWHNNELLNLPIHNIWCRPRNADFWALEMMLCEFENEKWLYRRNKNIKGDRKDFGWTTSDGLKIISPEIQLLYKSQKIREKDELDFHNCLPALGKERRKRLKSWLEIDFSSGHPWMHFL